MAFAETESIPMNFNSFEYILFLLGIVLVYWSLPRVWQQNTLLLIASYFFYARWDWRYLGLVIVSTMFNYGVGLWVARTSDSNRQRVMILGLAGNLGVLWFFKYFNFFITSVVGLLNGIGIQAEYTSLQIILPIGISFYTLQKITYLVSIYRRDCPPSRSLLNFAVFAAFFPQLVAGPIERAVTLLPQVEQPRQRNVEHFETGLILIFLGLFQKIVIADLAASLINPQIFIRPLDFSPGEVTAAIYLFALQIYGDFCGYSSIARGSALLLGFELMENFRQPYLAQTVTEFWQRWHISLSSWLRDYVFLPFSRSLLRRSSPRFSFLVFAVSTLLTMVISGLWHGANWTFVLWGGLLAIYLIISRQLQGKARPFMKHPLRAVRYLTIVTRILITFHLILMAWVLFRTPSIEQVPVVYQQIGNFIITGAVGSAGLKVFIPVLLLYVLTLGLDLAQVLTGELAFTRRFPTGSRTLIYLCGIFMIVVFSIKPYVPFIYFQF